MEYLKKYSIPGLVGIGILVVLIVGIYNSSKAKASDVCPHIGKTYTVTIKDSVISPKNTDAKKCDQITFLNKDNVTRNIAFGPHEHHVPYDGVTERLLDQNQSFTITLVSVGQYHFHDHFHDELTGTFSVEK
ncbi:MAG: cupredoxin domain-containing protein [Candidatus Saccharimonadales bacterium]